MNIRRVPLPELPATPEVAEAFIRAYGDQPEWSIALPMTYRILASPDTFEPFLAAPDQIEFTSPGYRRAAPYYSALLHLLVFHLGWPRPDRGIQAVVERGGDGAVLDLVHEIWDRDGTLELLWAWLVESGTDYLTELRHRLAEIAGRSADHTPPTPVQHLRGSLDRARREHMATPMTGGSDGLHLSSHVMSALSRRDDDDTRMLAADPAERTAQLTVPTLDGWYAALAMAGSSLPSLGSRSWHVHVYVDTVGYLGRFRRSRETGLWFSGRHKVHIWGQ